MKKVFRDPVHNLISFDKEKDKFIIDLINTPEMQRLRRIKQLGVSYITYPGADHTRFSHSLGVAYLASRVVEALDDSDEETRHCIEEIKEDGLFLVAAALLHDCGHGPFSHALELFTGKNHELWTIEIIKDSSTQVNRVLKSISAADEAIERVSKIIGRTDKPLLVKIITSQLDVDRFDYLLRDNIMTGAGYGKFDLEWMLHSLRVRKIADQPEIVLDISKGKHTAEKFILARYWMYNQVYYHKTTRSAEVLILKILKRAKETNKKIHLNKIMKKILKSDGSVSLTTGEYLTLDDITFLYHFKEWQGSADKILSDLCGRFLNRDLFKAIDTTEITKKIGTQGFFEKIYIPLKDKADSSKYPSGYYIGSDEPEIAPYKDYYLFPREKRKEGSKEEEEATKQIHVLLKDGKLDEFSRQSDIIDTLRNKSLTVERLYYPKELQENVSEIMGDAYV